MVGVVVAGAAGTGTLVSKARVLVLIPPVAARVMAVVTPNKGAAVVVGTVGVIRGVKGLLVTTAAALKEKFAKGSIGHGVKTGEYAYPQEYMGSIIGGG